MQARLKPTIVETLRQFYFKGGLPGFPANIILRWNYMIAFKTRINYDRKMFYELTFYGRNLRVFVIS
jgi:hypothetical protein